MSLSDWLEEKWREAALEPAGPLITDVADDVASVCRCVRNKAPIRLVLACCLARIDRPHMDVRKPYTQIKADDSFSGRFYDENYLQAFILSHELPCNSTTAFLTPALRNLAVPLTVGLAIEGRPREVYAAALRLLEAVATERLSAAQMIGAFFRELWLVQQENRSRMQQLLNELRKGGQESGLSAEEILTLLEQHLKCGNSSRLPVLMIYAAYGSLAHVLEESALPLESHNAADLQTGSLGDLEIIWNESGRKVACYEIKAKRVSRSDLDIAWAKAANSRTTIEQYLVITTHPIDVEVANYAASLYESTGVEWAVLDGLQFIRHFLHFFHRYRQRFLERYQELVLTEPESAVSQPLKEAFLSMRRAMESR